MKKLLGSLLHCLLRTKRATRTGEYKNQRIWRVTKASLKTPKLQAEQKKGNTKDVRLEQVLIHKKLKTKNDQDPQFKTKS